MSLAPALERRCGVSGRTSGCMVIGDTGRRNSATQRSSTCNWRWSCGNKELARLSAIAKRVTQRECQCQACCEHCARARKGSSWGKALALAREASDVAALRVRLLCLGEAGATEFHWDSAAMMDYSEHWVKGMAPSLDGLLYSRWRTAGKCGKSVALMWRAGMCAHGC